MTKRLLLVFAALLGLATAQAQEPIMGYPWVTQFGSSFDGFGDWTVASLTDNENVEFQSNSNYISSKAYSTSGEYYEADEWIISPLLAITESNLWFEMLADDNNGSGYGSLGSHFYVYAATSNVLDAFLATTPLIDTVIEYYSSSFYLFQASLDAYVGQGIFLAVRFVEDQSESSKSQFRINRIGVRSFNAPVLVLPYKERITDLGRSDTVAVVLAEGSLDGLSYSWTSNMMEDGTATYTVNDLGDTLVISHSAVGFDTLTVVVANVYDTVYDTIIFEVIDFNPIAVNTEQVYISGFEPDEDAGWVSYTDGPNNWYIDTGAHHTGNYGLYVSKDGLSNQYSWNAVQDGGTGMWIYSTTNAFAVRALTLTDTGDYTMAFNWRCDGFYSYNTAYDYMMVFLAKDFNGMNSDFDEWLDLTGRFANQTEWQDFSTVINLDSSWLGTAYIVAYWYNAGYNTNHPANPVAAAIDNFSFGISACSAPTGLLVDNITTSSATVSWAAGGTETSWAYSLDGEDYITVSATTVNLTDLEPGTAYTIRVRAVCGYDDESVDATLLFFTECGLVSTYPWRDDFESYAAEYGVSIGTQNPCWGSGTTVTYTGYPYVTEGYVSTKALYMYGFDNEWGAHTTWAVLPGFADPLGTMQMTLDIAHYYADYTSHLIIGAVDTNYYNLGDPFDTITVLETYSSMANHLENYSVDFSGYTGDKRYILLLKTGVSESDASQMFIDNIEVYPSPNCPRPSRIARAAATDASMTVAWNNTGAAEYDVALRASGGDGGWTHQIVDDTVATFDNLVSNTAYDIHVRAICDADDTSYASIATLRTFCAVDTFPYGEDFYNPATTPCWSVVSNNGSSGDDWYVTSYGSTYAGYTYGAEPADEYLISPTFYVPYDASEYLSLVFFYKYSPYDIAYYPGESRLDVLVSVDADGHDISTYTDTLLTITGLTDGYVKYSANISEYIGHTITLAFCRTSSGGIVDNCYLEDIEIREALEPEIAVSGNAVANVGFANELTVALSEGSMYGITYNWTSKMVDAGQATVSYNADHTVASFTYSAAGHDTIMATAQNAFGEDTVYVPVFVRDLHVITTLPYSTGFENAADNANWNTYSTTANNWYAAAAAAYTGSKSLYISNDEGLHNNYVVGSATTYAHAYRGIQLDAGEYYIAFNWHCGGSQHGAHLRPVLLPASTAIDGEMAFYPGNYDYIELGLSNYGLYASADAWQNYNYIFTVETAGLYILDFLWESESYGSAANPPAAIDNLSIGLLSCPSPMDIYMTGVSSDAMSVSWNVGGNESQWEVVFGDNAPVVVDTPYFAIDGLTPYADYVVAVRAICGAGDTSFALSESFRTECEAVMDLPWAEDFNTYAYGSAETEIECWTHMGGGVQTINRNITLSGNSETDRSLRIYRTSSDSLDFVTVLPAFHATIAALEMNFYARPDNGRAGTLEVGYINDVTEYGNFTPIASFSAADSATFYSNADSSFRFVLKSVSFANAPDGSRMAIRNHVDSYHAGNWYVDSVEVKVIDGVDPYACAAPTGISATKLMDGVYQLDWSAGNEHKWQVEITHNGNTEVRTVQNRPYTMSQIQPDDHYYIRVKAICTLTAESEWSEVYDMNTATPIDTTTTDTTGIGNVLAGSFSLMPNPATSTVTVSLSNVEGTATVAVIDMNGRKAGEWTVEDGLLTVDLNNYARGAYFVRVVAGEGTAVRKLIVH